MNNSLKKIWNVISSILVALVVILALLLVGARIVGLQVFTVLSGSMEPTYHTGSLIYVKKVDPYTIKEGQPITFMLDENRTHSHSYPHNNTSCAGEAARQILLWLWLLQLRHAGQLPQPGQRTPQ